MTISLREASDCLETPERELVAMGPRGWHTRQFFAGGGAAREREHIRAGRPDADPAACRIIGDSVVGQLVVKALSTVPRSVRWQATRAVTFVVIGRSMSAFFVDAVIPGRALIALDARGQSDGDLLATIGHELGHFWTSELSSTRVRQIAPFGYEMNAARERYIAAASLGEIESLAAADDRDEAIAAELSRQWGFDGPAADPAECVRASQARLARPPTDLEAS